MGDWQFDPNSLKQGSNNYMLQDFPLWTGDGNTWKLFKITKCCYLESQLDITNNNKKHIKILLPWLCKVPRSQERKQWIAITHPDDQPRGFWDILPISTARQQAPFRCTPQWKSQYSLHLGSQEDYSLIHQLTGPIKIDPTFHYLKIGSCYLLQVTSYGCCQMTSANINSWRP